MKPIDLRSDTVTKPSKAMREAIFNAEVGDDVFGEDPTVIKLQKKCAELSGKQNSLFVTTGCMGNQLAIKGHTIQGDEVICESEAHIFHYETSAPSIISNVQLHTVIGNKGVMQLDDIKAAIRSKEYYFPNTKLICLENTHNRAGGTIQPIESIKEIYAFAKENNIKVHIDGARIFNASVETGISLKEYAAYCDSISFCFSKGLGAPVGSILCGDYEFISIAHKWRKILGGGMRQSGILAAAAIFTLENNIERLKEDNDNAKYFAKEISASGKINLDLNAVQTNIVVFEVKSIVKDEFLESMKNKGVLLSSGSYSNIRAVFHLDVSKRRCENGNRNNSERFKEIILKRLLYILAVTCYVFFLNSDIFSQEIQKEICISVDDLPYATTIYKDISTGKYITGKLLSAFKIYNVIALGSVNIGKAIQNDLPDTAKLNLLNQWLDSGMMLANHTYAHKNYNKINFDEFKKDILDGELYLKDLLEQHGLKLIYFRHPFLFRGDSKEKADTLQSFLDSVGYIVAPVTIDNSDYIFSWAYEKVKSQKNDSLCKKNGNDYVRYMEDVLKYYEVQSVKLIGYNPKHILLCHANLINSDYINELLEMYKRNGYTFISIDDALRRIRVIQITKMNFIRKQVFPGFTDGHIL